MAKIKIKRSQIPGWQWLDYCSQFKVSPEVDMIEVEFDEYTVTTSSLNHKVETETKKVGLSEKSKKDFMDEIDEEYKNIIPWSRDKEDEEDEEEEIEVPEVPAFELTDRENEHTRILSSIAKRCYSNKNDGFTTWDKLDAISEELKDTGYIEVKRDHFVMYCREGFNDLDKDAPLYIISSHADNVPQITKPYSKIDEENHYYEGTYDNLGTNAASVILMKEEELPANVVFLFTANEETGKCTGVKRAVEALNNTGFHNLRGIALDVTWEGFEEGHLYSLENMSGTMCDASYTACMNIEPDEEMHSFSVTPIDKFTYPQTLDKEYWSGSIGMFDEGMAFRKRKVPAISFCLPTDGEMHSDSGLKCKQPTYEGYVLSLASFVYEITKTNPEKVEEYKEIRKTLLEKNTKLVEQEEALRKKNKSKHHNIWTFDNGYEYTPSLSTSDLSYKNTTSQDYEDFMTEVEEVLSETIQYCNTFKEFKLNAEAFYGDIDEGYLKTYWDTYQEYMEEYE